jgi:hypothetical protein
MPSRLSMKAGKDTIDGRSAIDKSFSLAESKVGSGTMDYTGIPLGSIPHHQSLGNVLQNQKMMMSEVELPDFMMKDKASVICTGLVKKKRAAGLLFSTSELNYYDPVTN